MVKLVAEASGRRSDRALTAAERTIVALIASGLSNDVVAAARGCSRSTVANQLTAAYRKLGISSRRELCALFSHERQRAARSSFLTEREQQVLSFAEFGLSNKLIAHSLGLSISTVSTTLTRARRKLGGGIGR
jgi:DNA-binding CsgD family transcriptional regulator